MLEKVYRLSGLDVPTDIVSLDTTQNTSVTKLWICNWRWSYEIKQRRHPYLQFNEYEMKMYSEHPRQVKKLDVSLLFKFSKN